ncbi:thioredoxin [Rhodobium gokarnense]|uniref:Thioredoxin n=1 Tax=Rhodobium gokarnense TaxID=364296 RepID=A0ABT3HHF7_9HYPH|nr:thioredoxin [Rhodobium gokarnense]MCW2309831.1 putative thioredoxin [Rhodobium gokarnense]
MSHPDFIIGGNGTSGGAAAGGVAKDTTTQTFMADVIEASAEVPVLVDFWAPWCGPCKQLAPALEKVVAETKGRVKLVKMNIDNHPEVAGQLGIQSIPAVIAFKDGKPLDGFMGALPESQIRQFVDKIAGPAEETGIDQALEAAAAAREDKDWGGAAQLYAAVLQEESDNVVALAGLSQCYAATGDLERARQTLAMVPDSKAGDPAVASARAAVELAEQAEKLGDPSELEERLSKDPDDHQARFDLALLLNAHNARSAAVDHLVQIVRRDRTWNEEAARKQLLQFFEAWGAKDPASAEGRRKLSAVLFS